MQTFGFLCGSIDRFASILPKVEKFPADGLGGAFGPDNLPVSLPKPVGGLMIETQCSICVDSSGYREQRLTFEPMQIGFVIRSWITSSCYF